MYLVDFKSMLCWVLKWENNLLELWCYLFSSKILEGGDTVFPEGVNYQRGGMGAAAGLHGRGASLAALAAAPARRHAIRAAADGVCCQKSTPPRPR